ncbi:MAG: hypothetical protein MI794_16705 [Pseudomonadales bacterium]|nr:hypothetical protein [Pseudomonadales bacterium]
MKWRHSLGYKAVLGIGLVELTMLAVMLWSIFQFIETSFSGEIDRHARSIVEVFAAVASDDVVARNVPALRQYAEQIASTPGTAFVRITDYQGVLLAQAGDSQALLQPFRSWQPGEALPDVFMTRQDIGRAGLDFGVIEVGLDLTGQNAALLELRHKSLMLGLIEMTLAAFISLLLGHFVVTRIARMVSRVRGMTAAGESIDPISGDELNTLEAELERLEQMLQWQRRQQRERIHQLETINGHCQRKLASQTSSILQSHGR